MTARADTESGAASAVASALTPEQLDIVETRARAVPPRWQQKFLAAVGDQLAPERLGEPPEILGGVSGGAHDVASFHPVLRSRLGKTHRTQASEHLLP